MKRTLLLFNNTTVSGLSNATDMFGPSHLTLDPATGAVFVDSSYTSVLEEVSPSTLSALWGLEIPAGDWGSAFDPVSNLLYVVGGPSGNVTVVDPLLRTVVSTSQVGETLASATWDANIGSLLLTDFQSNQLRFYDPASNTVNLTLNVGSGPNSATVDPVTGDIAVTDEFSNNVTVVGGSPLHVLRSVNVGSAPGASVYLPSLGELAVSNGGSGNVTFYNATHWTEVANVPAGPSPEGIAFDSASGDVAVANFGGGNVSLLNAATAKPAGQLSGLDEPDAALYDPVSDELVVAIRYTNNLSVVQGTTMMVVGEIPLGSTPSDLVMDTDNGLLYLANTYPGAAIVVNPVSFRVVRWIGVGNAPAAAGFDPVQDEVFIANGGFPTNGYNGSVSIISGASETVVSTLPTSPRPNDVYYDPLSQRVYVADGGTPINGWSGNVTVIDPASNTVVGTIRTGLCPEPDGLSLDPLTQDLLVACEQGSVLDLVNTTTNTVVGNITTWGAVTNSVYDPFNDHLDLTSDAFDEVMVFNASSLAWIGNISTGLANPTDLDVDTDNGYVAIDVEQAAETLIVNENDTVVATVPTSSGPDAIGFDPVQGIFFVDAGQGGAENEVPVLSAEFFHAKPSDFSLGNTTQLDLYVPDGGAVETYGYGNLPPGCSSLATDNSSLVSCTPTVAGNYSITAAVTDVYGKSASASVDFEVNPDPVVRSFDVSPTSVGIGVAATFSVLAVAGTPPYHYTFNDLPPGCSSESTTSLECTPTASGVFDVEVIAYDSDDQHGTAWTNLTVNPGPTILSFVLAPTEPVVGQPLLVATDVVGGTGALSYVYGGSLPPGCTSENEARFSCEPSLNGAYNVTVTVTDSVGLSAHAFAHLTVVPVLSIPSGGFTATPSLIDRGASSSLAVQIRGGSGTYQISYQDLPAPCISANATSISCAPGSAGTYPIEVIVEDTVGQRAAAWTNLTVMTPSPVGSSPWLLYGIVLGVIAAAAFVAAVLLLLRGRKRRHQESPDAGPAEVPPPPVYTQGMPFYPDPVNGGSASAYDTSGGPGGPPAPP